MRGNFVSISAVSNIGQLRDIKKVCREEGIDFPIVIGYQVSNRSINQGVNSARQPVFSDLGSINDETRQFGFVTAVHYYTKDNATILGDLEKVAESLNPKDTLLQLNTFPPSLEIMRGIKEMGFKTIFKVAVSDKSNSEGGYAVWKGEGVQDVSSGNLAPLVKQVYDRKDFIDYAMFDPSHGKNLDLVLDKDSLAVRFGRILLDDIDIMEKDMRLVYAGGIKPSNVRAVVKSLNSFFKDKFSIDTESGVRVNNRISIDLIREYLRGYRDEIGR